MDELSAAKMAPATTIALFVNDDETCATVKMVGEGHTLGNALRSVIARHPKTDFVGYSIPHPSERVINLRVQTTNGTIARDVMVEGTQNLKNICDVVLGQFEEEENSFMSN